MFESIDSEDCSHPDTLREESSSATTPTTDVAKQQLQGESAPLPAGDTGSHPDRVTSTGSKDTSSPDEGLGGSIAHTCSLSESRRSDSCDTEGNAEALKSESDDTTPAPSNSLGKILCKRQYVFPTTLFLPGNIRDTVKFFFQLIVTDSEVKHISSVMYITVFACGQ